MSNKEKLLENLGLKSTAVQIYLYLLNAKKATILEVAKETGIARTNIYNNVARLIQMGLVGEAIDSGKKFLVPESPNNLINFVKSKESIAKEAASLLQEDFLTNKYESRIKFATGSEGFKKFANETLKCKDKELKEIVNPNSLINYTNKSFMNSYWKKRVKNGIAVKILCNRNDIEPIDKQVNLGNNFRMLRDIRFLPNTLKFKTSLIVYDDKTHFFSPPEEGYIFLFESQSFTNTIKNLFNFLWEISEPY